MPDAWPPGRRRSAPAPSRASVNRQRLIDAIAPVRSLLVAVIGLPWQATGEHPVLDALNKLRAQYAAGVNRLPADVYARLQLPAKASEFLNPLLERVRAGVDAVAKAARAGTLRVDDELHLSPLAADEEDPEVTQLRSRLDQRIGEVQLPEVILPVDVEVRFSWIMLGREPRSGQELLMACAGILAHGTSLTAAECARMIPQLSATSIRQAMRWTGDERRLAQACRAVAEFMQRHAIAASWGRADLASSDTMSPETSRRVWQARQDPRRQTASVGVYSHVRDCWGIFHAQPIVLNERQAGAAIEGVVRQERVEDSQLAVDTHGYTDFAMALSRLLGFDLCPRLRELRQRHLFVPRGAKIPEEIAAV